MRIFRVPRGFSTNPEFISSNSDAGVELHVRECEDKSGFIAKLFDFFTGELIKNFYAETAELAVYAANEHVSRFEYQKMLASNELVFAN